MSQPEPNNPPQDVEIHLNEPAVLTGEIAGGAVRIRLDGTARRQMITYAGTDTSRELGGILIGTVAEGAETVVTVEAVIIARYTEAVQSSITFTHATWQDILAIKDRVYAEKKIIGWFHTHPGFGIFLSRYDLHIHENFFNLPWQIAYVVDPLEHTEGFFRWEDGSVRKTADYDVFGEAFMPAVAPPRNRLREALTDPRHYLILLLSLLVVYLAFFRPPRVRTITKTVVKPAPVAPKVPGVPKAPETPVYTVRPGDNLWKISERFYGSGFQLTRIMEANGLTSSVIHAGMRLKIPGGKAAD